MVGRVGGGVWGGWGVMVGWLFRLDKILVLFGQRRVGLYLYRAGLQSRIP